MAGNPGGAAPAGAPRPPARASRGQRRPFPGFPLRPPLTRGASAHLTNRTTCGTRELELARGGADRTVSEPRGAAGHPEPGRAGSRAMAGTSVGTRPPCAPSSRSGRRGPLPFAAREWFTADSAAPDPRSLQRPAGDRDRHRPLGQRTARGPFAAATSAPRRRDWLPGPRPPRPVRGLRTGESHPFASRYRWSSERTRPWSVVAAAENRERQALSAAGSRGWPGCARRCGTAGVPGHGAHAARGELRHDLRNYSSSGIGAHEHHGDVSRPPAFTAVRSPLQGPTHTQPAPVLAQTRERARGAPGLVTAGSTAGWQCRRSPRSAAGCRNRHSRCRPGTYSIAGCKALRWTAG